MSVMFWEGSILFRYNAIAMDPACCCVVAPITRCCGCTWLEDYWLANKRLRVTLSGAVTGYMILDAEPELPYESDCSRWSGSDDSNITDGCLLKPFTFEFICYPSTTPTGGMELRLTHGSTNCNLDSVMSADSADCGPPLSAVFSTNITEVLPTCFCDGSSITFTVSNEDTP